MTSYQLIVFTIAAVVGVMMILDHNVGDYIDLKLKHLVIQVKMLLFKLRFEIELSPVGRWWMQRKYEKIARELEKELASE